MFVFPGLGAAPLIAFVVGTIGVIKWVGVGAGAGAGKGEGP